MGEQRLAVEQVLDRQATGNQDVHDLARGAGVSLAGKLGGRVFYVGVQVLLARLLGPVAFGLYALGWSFLRLVGMLAPLGLHNGVLHYASRYWQTNRPALRGVIQQAVFFALLAGVALGALVFLAADWLALQVFEMPQLADVLRVFAPAFPAAAGLRVCAAATQVSRQMRYAVMAEDIAQPLVNLLLFMLLYLLGWRLLGAVVATVASFFVALLLSFVYVRRVIPEILPLSLSLFSDGQRGELLRFSLPTAFAGIFSVLVLTVDRLLVGYFRSAGEVGIYQAVSQTSIVFVMILSAFNAIFAPIISDLYHRGELERLNELSRVSTKWGFYLSLPVALVLCFAAQETLAVFFGAPYRSGSTALIILTGGQLINVATGSVGVLLIMTGNQRTWLALSAAALVVNIILNILLVPSFGIIGAALGTSAAVSALFIGGVLWIKRSLRIWPYDRRYFKGLTAALVSIVALLLLRSAPLESNLLRLALMTVATGSVFPLVLLALRIDREDQQLLQILRRRLLAAKGGNS